MTTREDVKYVFEKALKLLDEKEEIYGDSWKVGSTNTRISQIFRKANIVRIQWEKQHSTPEKLKEDLLDIMNWAAFAYWHLEREI